MSCHGYADANSNAQQLCAKQINFSRIFYLCRADIYYPLICDTKIRQLLCADNSSKLHCTCGIACITDLHLMCCETTPGFPLNQRNHFSLHENSIFFLSPYFTQDRVYTLL